MDRSYLYFGYIMQNDNERVGYAYGVNILIPGSSGGLTFDSDLSPIASSFAFPAFPGVLSRGSANGTTLYRLREGIERFLITDINNPASSAVAQSEVPVMWDYSAGNADTVRFNHIPGGANVLYMDGHVEFIRYPGRFPMSDLQVTVAGYGPTNGDNPGEG
jgi:prepilin-type processing-associated H-X9-DG protein